VGCHCRNFRDPGDIPLGAFRGTGLGLGSEATTAQLRSHPPGRSVPNLPKRPVAPAGPATPGKPYLHRSRVAKVTNAFAAFVSLVCSDSVSPTNTEKASVEYVSLQLAVLLVVPPVVRYRCDARFCACGVPLKMLPRRD
jgi:hypothetical protein